MFERFKKYHIITNFPKGYPFYKKLWANLTYFLTGIIVHQRRNALTHTDLIKARLMLRKGDICLFGNLRESSSFVIRGPFTHATLYLGRKRFIHAIADGVQYTSLHHLFTEYDTLAILRLPKMIRGRRKIIRNVIRHAEAQLGKPYDFDFSPGSGKFFCTELVNYAYRKAKHDTNLKTLSPFRKERDIIVKRIVSASRALHPVQMAEEGNFDVVFVSHNIEVKNRLRLRV